MSLYIHTQSPPCHYIHKLMLLCKQKTHIVTHRVFFNRLWLPPPDVWSMCWRTGTWSWVAARMLSLMRLIVWLTWASSPMSKRFWSTSRWPIRNLTPRRRRTLRRWWWTLNLENINTDKYVYLSDVCKHHTVVSEPGALTVCLWFQSL